MPFINQNTIRIFKSMTSDLEKIVEENKPKVKEFLSSAVRGGQINRELSDRVEQNCKANLFGMAFLR